MWKAKWSRFTECFCRRPGLVLVLLPCLIVVTLYLIPCADYEYDMLQYPSFKSYNVAEGKNRSRISLSRDLKHSTRIFIIAVYLRRINSWKSFQKTRGKNTKSCNFIDKIIGILFENTQR
jgi:hypothetical protein